MATLVFYPKPYTQLLTKIPMDSIKFLLQMSMYIVISLVRIYPNFVL
jgi:hypothetical protein